jgi:hypothetical protein
MLLEDTGQGNKKMNEKVYYKGKEEGEKFTVSIIQFQHKNSSRLRGSNNLDDGKHASQLEAEHTRLKIGAIFFFFMHWLSPEALDSFQ